MAMVIINIIKPCSIFMGLSTIIILTITITIFIIIAIITVLIAIITIITFMTFLFANVAGFLITIWFNLPICQWKLLLFLIVYNFCRMLFFRSAQNFSMQLVPCKNVFVFATIEWKVCVKWLFRHCIFAYFCCIRFFWTVISWVNFLSSNSVAAYKAKVIFKDLLFWLYFKIFSASLDIFIWQLSYLQKVLYGLSFIFALNE